MHGKRYPSFQHGSELQYQGLKLCLQATCQGLHGKLLLGAPHTSIEPSKASDLFQHNCFYLRYFAFTLSVVNGHSAS